MITAYLERLSDEIECLEAAIPNASGFYWLFLQARYATLRGHFNDFETC